MRRKEKLLSGKKLNAGLMHFKDYFYKTCSFFSKNLFHHLDGMKYVSVIAIATLAGGLQESVASETPTLCSCQHYSHFPY